MPFTVEHPADTAVRVEGEPFYDLARYTFDNKGDGKAVGFSFDVRAFRALPPSDAVGLLDGNDETGLIVWAGALGLLEWLLLPEESGRLEGALTGGPGPLTVVELGCGSGVLAVALHKLLLLVSGGGGGGGGGAASIVATDGNAECVALCARNLQEQCGRKDYDEGDPPAAVASRAALLRWDCAKDCAAIAAATAGRRLLLVAADVIYDRDAVPLLVGTAARLRAAFAASAAETTPTPVTEWWLLYTPRSLTRASNEAIYGALLAALAAQPGWSLEQRPLPPGAVSSGFEASEGDSGNYALVGCIFAMVMR